MVAGWQISLSIVFCLYGSLALYICFCIYQSVFKYRVHGLSLNMLIGLGVGIVAWIIAYTIEYKGL